MVFLILISAVAIYVAIAVLVSFGLYKLTQQKLLAALLLLVLLVAPVHEVVFGYPEFMEFEQLHRGIECTEVREAEEILVEGRRASSPRSARNASGLPLSFKITELPRQMVASMAPMPREPLKAYVQFYLTNQADPACTERLDSAPGMPDCIGVATSDTPRSQYAVLHEPDRRSGDVVLQMNRSKIFPIVGSHMRVRDLRTNQTIAEHWDFSLRSKVLPSIAWFSRSSPKGGIEASQCIQPASNSSH
jgi:hypothetical protein